jgi:Glycosyltransferase family 87
MATTELTRPSEGQPANVAGPPPRRRLRMFALPGELAGSDVHPVFLSWATSRALTLALMVVLEGSVTGDVNYYARSLFSLFHGSGLRETLQEYPMPVLLIMLPQYLIGGLNQVAFLVLFALSMMAIDAAFTILLVRASGHRRTDAVTFWLWFVPAIGPLAYFRFDLVPAALAGGAVLAAIGRPAISGFLTACGAALKLWPALMLPIFLLNRGRRRAVLVAFIATGGALALISLIIGGPARLVSPLRWQSARGLQIESIPAAPVMLLRMFDPHGPWTTSLSIYKAREIDGPWVHVLINISTVATALGVLGLGLLWNRARKLPEVSMQTLGWLFLATALILTDTNKVLSPQYILWLGGPLAALWIRLPGDRTARWCGRMVLVIAVMTQLDYPLLYPYLVNGGWVMPIATINLEARNVLLLVLTWRVCRQVWRLTKPTVAAAPDPVATAVAPLATIVGSPAGRRPEVRTVET